MADFVAEVAEEESTVTAGLGRTNVDVLVTSVTRNTSTTGKAEITGQPLGTHGTG